MFMGGSMSAVMLLLCYLPITMIIIILHVVIYSMYKNCIRNICVVISYMNHVSQYNSFLLRHHMCHIHRCQFANVISYFEILYDRYFN